MDNDTNLTRCALLIYAIYRTFNHVSHLPADPPSYNTLYDIATQYIYEGTIGHPLATSVLDNSYLSTRHPRNSPPHTPGFADDNLLDTNRGITEVCDIH